MINATAFTANAIAFKAKANLFSDNCTALLKNATRSLVNSILFRSMYIAFLINFYGFEGGQPDTTFMLMLQFIDEKV